MPHCEHHYSYFVKKKWRKEDAYLIMVNNVKGKPGKMKRQKLIKKGRKERHISESCQQTAVEHREYRKD